MPFSPPKDLIDPNRFQARHAALLGEEYDCVACLGEGGFGTVYQVKRRADGEVLAVKVLNEPGSEAALPRFEREHRALGEVDHSAIIRVYDARFATDGAYFEMSFCDGGNLSDRIHNPAWLDLTPEGRLNYMWQVGSRLLDAMEHYHARGLVHRDIKPQNILFTRGRPVMADFGTATMHEVESEGGDPSLFVTAPGLVVGTVLYMAPEQLMCEPPDIRCDIYALATVMFEMLTLELPYDGADKRSLAYKYRKLSFEADLSPLEGKVPPKVTAALGRALSRDPDGRYATPRAFHRALREAIHGTPREGGLPLRLLSGALVSRDPAQAETGRRSLAMARKRVRGWLEAAAAVSRGSGTLARLKQTFLQGLAGRGGGWIDFWIG